VKIRTGWKAFPNGAKQTEHVNSYGCIITGFEQGGYEADKENKMTQNNETLPGSAADPTGETTVQAELPQAVDQPDKECPRCQLGSPQDSTTCWACGYNFETGQTAAPEQAIGEPSQAATARTASISPAAIGAVVSVAAYQGEEQPVVSLAPPVLDDNRSAVVRTDRPFRQEDVVYAVDMPTATGGAGAHGEKVEGALLGAITSVSGDQTMATVAVATPAPPVLAAAATPTTGALEVEEGAISIPPFEIVHPSVPHAVLIVDFEFRRSRPPGMSAPAMRMPVILELTGEAHPFGRKIRSLCLDFDTHASGLHATFVRRAGGGYSIRDQSTNGTKLNGRYIERDMPTPLKDKDVITLGSWTKIIYFQGGSP
jgi:hypothetical protein